MALAMISKAPALRPQVRSKAQGPRRGRTGFAKPAPVTPVGPGPVIQPKLTVGAPNDRFEQEADRVADRVMRMPDPAHTGPIESGGQAAAERIQRKCSACEEEVRRQPIEEEEEELQMKRAPGAAPEIGPGLQAQIGGLRGGGRPLSPAARSFFEPRFGYDFSSVRVHTDGTAADVARSINARAFTMGRNVVFGQGTYQPATDPGRRLLAHELTHVVQQGSVGRAQAIPSGGNEAQSVLQQNSVRPGGLRRCIQRQRGPTGGNIEFRPHEPAALPPISPPRIPHTPQPPSECPAEAEARREIRDSDVVGLTEREMRRTINLEQSRAAAQRPIRLTQGLVEQVDRAVRAEFGNHLPSGRRFTSPDAITVRTPDEFAEMRVPGPSEAKERIANAALTASRRAAAQQSRRVAREFQLDIGSSSLDVLLRLCITDPSDPVLQREVTDPLLRRLGIDFVRRYELSGIGGQTRFTTTAGGQISPHVDVPDQSRMIGHILVHEAMHFYVGAAYYQAADGSPLEDMLIEGGAEFLARHVINQRLAAVPAFRINTSVFDSEFRWVRENLLRGGLSVFAQAYFAGQIDLLGLPLAATPAPAPESGRTVRPPGTAIEEAERLGEEFREERRGELSTIIAGLRFRKILRDCPEESGVRLLEVLRRMRARANSRRTCVSLFQQNFNIQSSQLFVENRPPTIMVVPRLRGSGVTRCPSPSIRIGEDVCRSPLLERVLMHELTHYAGCLTLSNRPSSEALAHRGSDLCMGTVREVLDAAD